MKVWPENDPKARPASEFFVNERIDLLIREAETFRNDYRDTGPADRLPRAEKTDPLHEADRPGASVSEYVERDDEIETPRILRIRAGGHHHRLRRGFHPHHLPAEPADALRELGRMPCIMICGKRE